MLPYRGKQILTASYLAFSCLVSCLGAALRVPPAEITSPTIAETQEPPSPTESLYILREYVGQVGVYTPDGTLIRALDIPILSLPAADRRMLSQGITLFSEEELQTIIQDYGG